MTDPDPRAAITFHLAQFNVARAKGPTDGPVMTEFMANLDRITRLNSVGTARWEFPPASDRGQGQFYATPAVTEDVIYVGGFDKKVYAIDGDNGQQIWATEELTGQIIAGLTVAQGKVIVGLGDRHVVALNQTNGQQVWLFETGQGVWATPLVVGDVVYITSLDKNMYALDLATGEEIWRTNLDGAVAGTPAYDGDGVLYVGNFAHKVYAISAVDGAILRTFETNNWVWGGPSLVDGMLYFGDLSGNLYVLDAVSFAPQWQRQVAEEAIRATPLVVGNLVIVGSRDDSVYAVDRESGASVWKQVAGGDVLSDLTMLDSDTVVVSTVNPEQMLIAYDVNNAGQEVWRYPPATAASE